MKRKNLGVFSYQIYTFLRLHLPFSFVNFYYIQLSTFKRQIFSGIIIYLYILDLQFITSTKNKLSYRKIKTTLF